MFLMGGNLEALGSDNTTVGEEILLQATPQPRHDAILHFRFLLQAHAPPEIHPLHLSENCTGKESTNRFSDCNSFISFLSTNTNVSDFYQVYILRLSGIYISSVLQIRIRIRIRRIQMFLGLLDPDTLVRCMDLDPSVIKQK